MLIVRSLQYQISASYCRMYQISVGIMGSQGSHCHIVLLLAQISVGILGSQGSHVHMVTLFCCWHRIRRILVVY